MGDPDSKLNSFIKSVRATIISSKGGVPVHKLRGDYRELNGSEAPFRDFGFKSMEEFLQSYPNEFVIAGGVVQAYDKSSSSHVSSLIRQQNSSKKAKSRGRMPSFASARRPVRETPPHHSDWRNHRETAMGRGRFESSSPVKNMRPPNQGLADNGLREIDPKRPERLPWAKELFINDNDNSKWVRKVSSRKAPEDDYGERSTIKTEPISKFKAKEVPSRNPYRHRVEHTSSQADLRDLIERRKMEKITRTIVNERATENNSTDLFDDYATLDEVTKNTKTPDEDVSAEENRDLSEDSSKDLFADYSNIETPWSVSEEVSIDSKQDLRERIQQLKAKKNDLFDDYQNIEDDQFEFFAGSNSESLHSAGSISSEQFSGERDLPLEIEHEQLKNSDDLFSDYHHIDDEKLRLLEGGMNPNTITKPNRPETVNVRPPLLPTPSFPPSMLPPALSSSSKNPAARRLEKLQGQKGSEVRVDGAPSSVNNLNDIQKRLLDLCVSKTLPPPEIQTFSTRSGNGLFYNSIVKVGNVHYKSEHLADENTARNLALSNAFRALSSQSSNSTNSASPKVDELVFLSRVRQMAENSGIWMSKLEEAYQETYSSSVPPNWKDLISRCPSLTETRTFGQTILQLNPNVSESETTPIIPSAIAPPPAIPAAVTPVRKEFSSPLSAFSSSIPLSSISSEKTTGSPLRSVDVKMAETLQPLPQLQFPKSDYWDIYVVHTKRASEIYCRLIGREYSDEYDNLMAALELELELRKPTAVNRPVLGETYVACVENQWLRVTLSECHSDGTATVYCMDEGDNEVVKLSELCVLDAKYRMLPAQAFPVSLQGLEKFPEVMEMNELLLDILMGKIYVAETVDQVPESVSLSSPPKVVFWDTRTEDDINVNVLLMESITGLLTGPILSKGETKEMHLSHISDTGTVFLQNAEPSIGCIAAYIWYLVSSGEFTEATPASNFNFDKVYLIKNPVCNFYQRAKICKISNSGEATVLFIDYGTEGFSSMTNLYDLSSLSYALASAPAQAKRVSLAGVSRFVKSMAQRVRSQVKANDIVVAKVVDNEDGIPVVELFLRRPDSVMTPINSMFKIIHEETEPDVERDQCTSVKILQTSLPSLNSVFYVTVTFVVSPNNFQVHSTSNGDALSELMNELQEEFQNPTVAPDVSTLSSGSFYAYLHSDNFWYRVKLDAIIGNDQLYIHLIDFGEPVVAPAISIRYLPEKFTTLPSLSIKARLANVEPAHIDWAPADTVLFQELVLQRDLASVVRNISIEKEQPVLELQLIDTSGSDDVYIDNLLVDKGIAKFKTKQ